MIPKGDGAIMARQDRSAIRRLSANAASDLALDLGGLGLYPKGYSCGKDSSPLARLPR